MNAYLQDIHALTLPPARFVRMVHCVCVPAAPEKVPFYVWPHAKLPKLVSREEFLWLAIQKYCEDNCHHLVYDLRGKHRIRITWGDHTTSHDREEAPDFGTLVELVNSLICARIKFLEASSLRRYDWKPSSGAY